MMKVLLYQDTGAAIAAWVEKDVFAQGPTKEVALDRLKASIFAHAMWDDMDGREPFEQTSPPPYVYRNMYDRAEPWSGDAPVGCEEWAIRFSLEPSPLKWCKGKVMPTESTASEQRISLWKDFRKTSLQQFDRVQGRRLDNVILLLDARDEFAVHLARVTYRAALKESFADPTPDEELGTLAIIGAPFVLVLPLGAAIAALESLFPQASKSLEIPPPLGEVRVAILQDVGTGPGCSVITDKVLKPKKSN